jgi:hypothetical protein
MDATKLGQFAAQFMQQIEEDWPDGVIRDIALVISLDDKTDSVILNGCTDDRIWVQRAMYDEALDNLDDIVWLARKDEDDE